MSGPTCHLLVGNIASGKSSLAYELGLPVVSKDAIRYLIGSGDYVFDRSLEPQIHKIYMEFIKLLSSAGVDFIVDECNVTRASRLKIIKTLPPGYSVVCHVGIDRGEKSHVDARMRDNHGNTPRETWVKVYNDFAKRFESPHMDEGFSSIRFIDFT